VSAEHEAHAVDAVSLTEAARVWAKIGCLSFGGPAGQIALMHRELVEERRWVDESRFLHALNYCAMLPGPEAQQLAIYLGWLLHRTPGGVVAGTLFVLPGLVAVLALSVLYARLHALPAVASIFLGLKCAVLALVVEALMRVGKRALDSRPKILIAASAFVAIALFRAPFPAIMVGAAIVGSVLHRLAPGAFARPAGATPTTAGATLIDRMADRGELDHTRPSRTQSVRVVAVCAVLWALPMVLIAALGGSRSVLVAEGLFFSKASLVTFGGAYAVLAYVAEHAVHTHGWLSASEMLDGLGLAESTPGPLILVVEFVGFLGAYRHPGTLSPLVAGVLGALITAWVTFLPCFVWIFLGAPHVEALRQNRPISAALSGITAAVVGVIANLSLWFGIHVLFARIGEGGSGPLHWPVPELTSVDPFAVACAAIALVLLLRFKLGVPMTLLICASIALVTKLLA